MAEKRGLETNTQGYKNFFYIAGLAEGTETIAFFALSLSGRHIYSGSFYLCRHVYLSVIGRVANSYLILKELPSDT